MAKKTSANFSAKLAGKNAFRFAHPFFTTVPIQKRKAIPGIGVRMIDHIKSKLEKIPNPQREPTMSLAEIIGEAGVTDRKSVV